MEPETQTERRNDVPSRFFAKTPLHHIPPCSTKQTTGTPNAVVVKEEPQAVAQPTSCRPGAIEAPEAFAHLLKLT